MFQQILRFNFLIVLICFFTTNSYAQVIQGTVTDRSGRPLTNVSVTALAQDSVTIQRFAITGTGGNFKIMRTGSAPFIFIRASLLGYQTLLTRLQSGDQALKLTLREDTSALKEVVIRAPTALTKRGDTLSYDVNTFTKQQDRTIGDVIRNLPGITVNSQGQISYQGRAINKFYIDGDDLLGNKYNLATAAVPADAVEKVQVYENHQPINVLRGVASSDQAALNLKLKNTAKLQVFGTIEAAAGLPGALNGKADLMMFKDKIKFLNTIAYNNVGNDLGFLINAHSLEDLLNTFDQPLNRSLVSVRTVLEPPLDRERWLFNKSALVSANTLVKFDRISSLRINAYFKPGEIRQQYFSTKQYFQPGLTSSQIEDQHLTTRNRNWSASFDYQKNADKIYIDNKVDLQIDKEEDAASLLTETGIYAQSAVRNKYNIQNNFRLLDPLSKALTIEVLSRTGYTNAPDKLKVNPGIYPNLLNDSVPYSGTRQYIDKNAWYTKNKLSLRVNQGKFQQSYDGLFDLEQININSDISLQTNGDAIKTLPYPFANRTKWNDHKVGVQANYAYNFRNFNLIAALPLDVRNITYSDSSVPHEERSRGYTLFNPLLTLKWSPGGKHTITLRGRSSTDLGDAEDILPGQIIANYRTVTSNSGILNKRDNKAINISYGYRDPISVFFFTSGLTYNLINNNTITKIEIDPDGLTLLERRPDHNSADRLTLLGNLSKYFFDLRTTWRGGINITWSQQDQLQNDVRLRAASRSFNTYTEIDSKLSDRYNFNYKLDFFTAQSQTRLKGNAFGNSRMHQFNQRATFAYSPSQNISLLTTGQLLNIRSDNLVSDIFFNDYKLTWTLPVTKTDLGISLINAFNNRIYRTQALDLTSSQSLQYELRPRLIMFNIRFTL